MSRKNVKIKLADTDSTASSKYFGTKNAAEPSHSRLTLTNTMWDRIPRTKEDWMKFMVDMIKRKTDLHHMSDKDIEGTIKRARHVLFVPKKAKIDPHMPDCYYWKASRVAEWIEKLGFPDAKQMFLLNRINGRRLIQVDACALNQMGMKDLSRTMQVTKHIRGILGIPAPNALRAIMRLVPLELYLRRKVRTGTKTDLLTFKSFCRSLGFPYELVKNNPCCKIPPACDVEITPACVTGAEHWCKSAVDSSEDSTDADSDEDSLKYCSTVEFVVRKQPIHDMVIKDVLDNIIQLVLQELGVRQNKRDEELAKAEAEAKAREKNPIEYRVRDIFSKAYVELGIEVPELSQQRVEFVASVAKQLMNDILRTQEIIEDMDTFQDYMENSMDLTTMTKAREIAQDVLEDVSPIAALLALGQLELSALIREAPCLKEFVTDIVTDAENEIAIRQSLTENKKHLHKHRPSKTRKISASNPVKEVLSDTKLRLVNEIKKSYHFHQDRPEKR